MQLLFVNTEEGIAAIPKLLQNQKEALIVNFGDRMWCVSGQNAGFNEEVCQKLELPIYPAWYLGGTIVVFPGDFNIVEVKKGHSTLGERVIK